MNRLISLPVCQHDALRVNQVYSRRVNLHYFPLGNRLRHQVLNLQDCLRSSLLYVRLRHQLLSQVRVHLRSRRIFPQISQQLIPHVFLHHNLANCPHLSLVFNHHNNQFPFLQHFRLLSHQSNPLKRRRRSQVENLITTPQCNLVDYHLKFQVLSQVYNLLFNLLVIPSHNLLHSLVFNLVINPLHNL